MSTELIILIGLPLLFIVYCITVIWIFFSPSSISSILSGAPTVPTPKKEIMCAFKAAEISEGDILYDLGSGTGRVLKIAEKDFKAEARGLEYSLFWVLFSKISFMLSNVSAKIVWKSFLEEDFSNADVLYIYGSEKLIKKLSENFKKNKTSVKIISYCFKFPNLTPKKEIKTPKGRKVFIYEI